MVRQRILLLFGLVLLVMLNSCTREELPERGAEESIMTEGVKSASATERISVFRQRLSQNFDLSETGIYCLRKEKMTKPPEESLTDGEGVFLLYCEADSDTFVKVCGRPDCMHNSSKCDAYLPGMVLNIHYYRGELYYVDHEIFTVEYELSGEPVLKRIPKSFNKMGKNGRERKKITDLYPEDLVGKYQGSTGEYYSLGYVKIGLEEIAETEGDIEHRYGLLDQPGYFQPMPGPKVNSMFNGTVVNTIGNEILISYTGESNEDGTLLYQSIYRWNPREGSNELIGEAPIEKKCCFGLDHAYYCEEGKIIEWDYRSHMERVVAEPEEAEGDTLHCFPDCMMITDSIGSASERENNYVAARFYNYDYQYLGECRVPLQANAKGRSILFGETENRILLRDTNDYMALPAYYIEKSDFGTGEIRLHEYHFPEE